MKALFLSLIFINCALAFDKDFKTVNERVPLEFSLMFDSLKLEIKTDQEKVQMVAYCQELDKNLGFLQKDHIFLLMKSEVIKNVLEHRFSQVRQFDVSTLLIERLEESFKDKQKLLNPFSRWIWRSVIAELNHRRSLGLITSTSFNPQSFEGPKRDEAQRFQKYLHYLMPWIDRMDNLNPSQFNSLAKEVSWEVLRKMNDHSLLFRNFASSSVGDTKITLFNIPSKLLEIHPQELRRIKSDDQIPQTLEEQGQMEKNEAETKMEKITPQDMSPVSDDVMKKLDEQLK